MFTGRERTGINRNYDNSHLWKPALVAAGVIGPKVGEYYDPSREHGFHALRHAYASWLLAEKTRKAIDLALGAAVDGLPSSLVPGLYREGA